MGGTDMEKRSYEDIIDLPHHVSPTRKRMPIKDRAAQFAPFAALTGHYAAIDATARRVASKEQLRAVADEYANDYTDMLSDIQPDND